VSIASSLSLSVIVLALAGSTALAADPPGYVVWPKGLPPEGSPQKIQFEHHSWSLAHREKSGIVESHGTRTIVMIVQSGEATLVVGSDVVGAQNTSPTEVRGTSIRNGIERKVSAGDVINMPAGLPHQFLLEPGKQITYIDVVVNTSEK
jgi:mannose-6-phosphate isomerase-like protein (cupin superfamily)